MRRLTILVLVLAALYSGYWVIGARSVQGGVRAALSGLEAQGWDIGTTTVRTHGFPSRFDTTLSDVSLTAPDGALRFRTPFLQGLALSYRPNHLIMVAAPTQVLDLQGQELTLNATGLRASTALGANADLPLDTFAVEAQDIDLSVSAGYQLRSGKLLLAARHAGPAAHSYDAYLNIADLRLPFLFAPPQPMDHLVIDAQLRLDRALDRHLLDAGLSPQIVEITVNDIQLDWAGASLRGSGSLSIDAQGYPSGEVALEIADHATLIGQLADVGVIDPGVAPTWVNMGDALAEGAQTLSLPLRIANGAIFLGPFPIGLAPRLQL